MFKDRRNFDVGETCCNWIYRDSGSNFYLAEACERFATRSAIATPQDLRHIHERVVVGTAFTVGRDAHNHLFEAFATHGSRNVSRTSRFR